MMDLKPAELAFRVGVGAGVLGALGRLPANLQWMAAFVLFVIAAVYFYELWVVRGFPRKQRNALILAVAALAGAGALTQGLMALISMPLLVLSAVCIALSVAATLAESSDDTPDETVH